MASKASHVRGTIVGLGMTEMGRIYNRTAADFATEAVIAAVADAGLLLKDIDGLLISAGVSDELGLRLQNDLGLSALSFLSKVQAFGSTAGGMVQMASLAVSNGLATTVVCVFADAPLREGRNAGAVYGANRGAPMGWQGLLGATGVTKATTMYALAARRHMETYGTTSEQFGAIAVAQREWALLNPKAQMRDQLTLSDHQASRWISEPLRLLDCCLVSNGAVAVVVTTPDRAAHLRQPPVHLLGYGQSHPGLYMRKSEKYGLETGARQSGPRALAMAGIGLSEIDIVELYDCYTYTVLVSLEDYGFCGKGEGGAFVGSGVLGPRGSLKLNTGGGQLSSYYMWGMTPLSEAVIQVRGQAGDRQSVKHDLALVSGNGGILDYHSTLILGSRATYS
jgi:acetyl-CoA acetyltransferase